jgi:hypothetical protein
MLRVPAQQREGSHMPPMPRPNDNAAESFRSYYGGLTTEESKLKFLQMLKERRDLHNDFIASALLPELVDRWISERIKKVKPE